MAFSPNPQRDVPVFADSKLIAVLRMLFFAVSNTVEHVRDGLCDHKWSFPDGEQFLALTEPGRHIPDVHQVTNTKPSLL